VSRAVVSAALGLCAAASEAQTPAPAAESQPATGATGATVEAKVIARDGSPLPGATCVLVELARETTADAKGVCRFENVAEGHYDVRAQLAGFASRRVGVDVTASGASVEIELAEGVHFTESVTVSTRTTDTFEAYQPTSVVGGEDLLGRLATNLGDTLRAQPGVNVRAFGPGPSRPVIRGLDGDRVLVVENGTRTGDLSSQSGDHGVSLDPGSATQIEVVRGPATLLYGGNALGGVVNVVSDEIPMRPVDGVDGFLTLHGGSGNRQAGASAGLSLGNKAWAFRIGGAGNRTGDIETPSGALPNSQSDLKAGSAALSRTSDKGYFGVSYGYTDTSYGVPLVEEGETTLNPRRHRFDIRGERRQMGGFLEGIKFVGGYRNYKHDELEGDGRIATSFENKFGEAQLLLNHRPSGRLRGTFGLWATHRDYATAGAEALAPPVTQNAFASFLYEELTFHHFGLQFGARVERNSFDTAATGAPAAGAPSRADRTFTELSGSLGVLGFLNDDVTVALNLARAARNPSLEELYNFGPHAGNFAFEIGDSSLASERGFGADFSLRWRKPRFSGEITLFSNWIDDFIFPLQTGEEQDEFPVVQFVGRNAQLRGFEAHLDVGLTEKLSLELGGDGVKGSDRDTDDPLPRMPPYRGWAGLRYATKNFHLDAEVRGAARQGRIHGVERPTGRYALLNLHASYKIVRAAAVHTFTLGVDNATDQLWRNHLNLIKRFAPEMGRTLKAAYTIRF
jgi:iron complex outermembrane receptor protein